MSRMTRSDEVELAIWRDYAAHCAGQPCLSRAEVDEIVRRFVAAEEKARDWLSRVRESGVWAGEPLASSSER